MSDKRIRSHKSCTLLEMAIQFIMDFFIYLCSFVHISYLYYVHSSKYIIDLLHPLADAHKESRRYHSDLAKAVGLLYYFFVCICYRQQFIAGIYLMMSMDTIISPGNKGTLSLRLWPLVAPFILETHFVVFLIMCATSNQMCSSPCTVTNADIACTYDSYPIYPFAFRTHTHHLGEGPFTESWLNIQMFFSAGMWFTVRPR